MSLVPAAQGWTLISPGAESGVWRVRGFPNLDEAAQALNASDDFVLALPVSAILAQRIRLPNVEGTELREMVRIQIEKDERWPLVRAGLSVRAVISHGDGDAQWAEQAAAKMRELETRYNQPQPSDRGTGPGDQP